MSQPGAGGADAGPGGSGVASGPAAAHGETTLPRRLRREQRTLEVMIGMYCRDHHSGPGSGEGLPPSGGGSSRSLCPECAELLDYARARLARCRYGADKPTCAVCPTHCYSSAMREQVRAVMRYSGPRMLRTHPLLAVAHLIDGHRRVPPRRLE